MASPEDFGAVAAAPRPEDFGAVAVPHDSTTMDVIKSAGQGVMDTVLGISAALRDGFKMANFPVIGQIYGHGALADMLIGKQQHPENAAAIEKGYWDQHHFQPTELGTKLSDLHAPETTPGKYARAGAAGVTSGLMFGPSGVLPGLTSGLGSQAGGDIGAEVGFPKTGAVIGGLAGGMLPLAAAGAYGVATRPLVGNNAEKAARSAMEGMTPEDFAKAQAVQQQAKNTGIPLSGAESTGNAQLIGMQRTLEQQPGSAPVLSDFYQNRPQQVTEAVNRAQVPIGITGNIDPALVGAETRSAAELALKRAEQTRTNNTAQEYAKSEMATVKPDAMQGLVDRMATVIASDKTGTLAPTLEKARNMLMNKDAPIVDISNLDRAKKAIRDMAEVPPFGADPGAKEASKYLKNFVAQLDGIMKTSRPYKNAAADFAAESPAVDNKINGTVGALTKTVDPASQWKRLVDPELSRPGTITATAKDLVTSNPDAYRNLVRVGLEGEINSVFKATANPANQNVGAMIAKNWYGTPQRLENVREAVANLPNGGDALKALDNVMQVLRQTGLRQSTGSPTASNAANVGALGPGAITNMEVHPIKGLAENLDTAFTARSAKNLAKILTDPDSVSLLKKISEYNPVEPYAKDGIIGTINSFSPQKKR